MEMRKEIGMAEVEIRKMMDSLERGLSICGGVRIVSIFELGVKYK